MRPISYRIGYHRETKYKLNLRFIHNWVITGGHPMDSALVAAGLLCVVIVCRFCQRGWLLGQVCFKWLSWPSAFSFLLVTFSPVFFRENLKFRKRKRWKSLCMPTNLCWTTCPPDTLESLCRCFTGYDVLIFSGSTFVGPFVGPSSDRIGKTLRKFWCLKHHSAYRRWRVKVLIYFSQSV
jgi:hypothetical protein